MAAELGWVYIAINSSFPGLVKIGVTTKPPAQRMKELSAASGVPTPFVLAFSRHVEMPFSVETALHDQFEFCRVNDSREFFEMPLHEAITAVELYEEIPEIEEEQSRALRLLMAVQTPYADLFATFPDDGTARELTEAERAKVRELDYILS